ncbi:MAG: hypothetical protein U0L92_03745 [Clostridia bacterium]|nr:hypothetical protein [Clostridia bacterium]
MEHQRLELIRKIEYPVLGQRPVEILRSRLYRDTDTQQVILYLDMRNVSGKTVTEAYLDLCCFDEDVSLIATKNQEPYEKLHVPDNGDFGSETPIQLSSLRTCSITATVHKVCFGDGTVWDCYEGETAPTAKKQRLPGLSKELKEIWAHTAQDAASKRRLGWILALILVVGALGGGIGLYQSHQETTRQQALHLFQNRLYTEAEATFASLKGWVPGTSTEEIRWYQALCRIQTGDISGAVQLLAAQPEHETSVNCLRQLNTLLAMTVSAGENHSVGLCADGTAMAAGDDTAGQCRVSDWHSLAGVTAGWNHTLGLKADGTVLYAGAENTEYGKVADWKNVVAVAAGEHHSVAVLGNGRVVAVGDDTYGQCDTADWSGIVAVAAGRNHTVALRQDGTVYATGDNPTGGCNVEKWQNVIAIAAGDGFTLGLTKDGAVLAAGDGERCGNLTDYTKHMTAVSAGASHGLALGSDGILRGSGKDDWHQTQVGHWESVLSASGGSYHSVGIRIDGTAYAIGGNQKGQCNVGSWTNMGIPQEALTLTGIQIQ